MAQVAWRPALYSMQWPDQRSLCIPGHACLPHLMQYHGKQFNYTKTRKFREWQLPFSCTALISGIKSAARTRRAHGDLLLQTCVSERSPNTAALCAEHTHCQVRKTNRNVSVSRHKWKSREQRFSCRKAPSAAAGQLERHPRFPRACHTTTLSCPCSGLLDPLTPPCTHVNAVQPGEQAAQIF